MLDSLEEIKDGRAYNIDVGQVIHTICEETPKEEKKQKIIALLKSNTELVERIAEKKAYNANMRQIETFAHKCGFDSFDLATSGVHI